MLKTTFDYAANAVLKIVVSVKGDAKADLCDTIQRKLRSFKRHVLSVYLCPDNQDFCLVTF